MHLTMSTRVCTLATQRINLLGMCANGFLPKQSLLLRCAFSLAVVILSIVSAGCFPPKPLRVRSFVEVPVYRAPASPAPGGRVVTVTVDSSNDKVAIAATHSGGLFRTADGGMSWQHLDGLEPNRLWDVQIDASDGHNVIATIVLDTHDPPLSGLWRSTDGGTTWSRPPTASFPDCTIAGQLQEPYGRWISFGPTPHVFVGTDCGLAVSHDHGSTWSLAVAKAGTPGVMGVVSRPGSGYPANLNDVIVDVCGNAGPFRSTDAGATFNGGATGTAFPIQLCSLAPSPDNTSVVFAASKSGGDGILWESDDGGITWTELWRLTNPGRYPWVRSTRTVSTPAPAFDLFFHAGADVFRVPCDSSRTGPRCAVPSGGPPRFTSPPHDYGGMAFSASGCPRFMGNDHGVIVSADCGQTWSWVHEGLHALQIYSLAGTVLPGEADLYFATQDNDIWSSSDRGATWKSANLPEGLDLQAPHTEPQLGVAIVTGTFCAPCSRVAWRDHLAGMQSWPLPADQNFPNPNGSPPFVVPGNSGAPTFIESENSNLWIRPPSGSWKQVPLAQPLPQLATTQLFISGPENDPTVYAVASRQDGTHTLLRITGLNQATVTSTDVGTSLGDVYFWAPDDNPWRFPFVVGVSPQDFRFSMVADRLPGVIRTTIDGGNTWFTDAALNKLVIDGGHLRFHSPFHGLQAHVIKYNPANGGHILVGTEATGVIESCNGGYSWQRVDGSLAAKAISDFFFDELHRSVYVATYGRGLWRMDYPRPLRGRDPCWDGIGPITVPPPSQLSISVMTAPLGDPARVDVRVDAILWVSAASGGVVTPARPLPPGVHQVQATLTPPFTTALYDIIFTGACTGGGVINLAQGQTAICNIQIKHR